MLKWLKPLIERKQESFFVEIMFILKIKYKISARTQRPIPIT